MRSFSKAQLDKMLAYRCRKERWLCPKCKNFGQFRDLVDTKWVWKCKTCKFIVPD